MDDAWVPPLRQLVRRRRASLCADRQWPHPISALSGVGRRDCAARLRSGHAFLPVRVSPPRPLDGGIGGAGAWQSYYDAIFPFAPLVVGGIVYGLLHPSESLLSRVMRVGLLRKTGELSFGVYLVHVPMIVLIGSRYGFGPLQFSAAIAATFAAAAVLSALIEKPAIAFGRELGHWLLARRPASPAIPLPVAQAADERTLESVGGFRIGMQRPLRAIRVRRSGRRRPARAAGPAVSGPTGSSRCCRGTGARSPSR